MFTDNQNDVLLLKPAFSHNIWGGTRLARDFGYDVEGNDIGECWGISAYPGYESQVCANGEYIPLSVFYKENPAVFGNIQDEKFPLLVKIIDAKDMLSIQVHPDDAYAMKNENGSLGKTECWYILDCPKVEPHLVIGHNARTKEELISMIDEKKWGELIHEIPVKKGDFIQIDPRTVHAIKGDFLILETQQNSDITYRVYDYDRLNNGKPRELHIKKSIDVITIPDGNKENAVISTADTSANELHTLSTSKYYEIYKLKVEKQVTITRKGPFMLGTVISGSGTVENTPVKKGDHFIIPNSNAEIIMDGCMELILSTVGAE